MRRATAALVLAGAAALAAAPAAAAVPPKSLLTLVDPTTTLTQQPPLIGALGEQEARVFRQKVDSAERVTVGIDATGKPVSVVVVQRLQVIGLGDYLYTVPGPVRIVTATRDSESVPGQRHGAIRWAGFSPGHRLLGARAHLDHSRAAPFLPLRVSISATVDGRPLAAGTTASGRLELVVTLRNATQTAAPTASALTAAAPLARALDGARRGIYPLGGVSVIVQQPVEARTALIEAPLAIRGEITFPAGRIGGGVATGARLAGRQLRFSVLLGDGLPLTHVVRLTGRAIGVTAPKLRLVARPVKPQRSIVPPRGSTWAEALRLDPQLDPRKLLTIAENAFLRASRAEQYQTFLANPGPTGAGTSTGDYVYVTAPPRAAPAPPPSTGGGLGTLGLALALVGGLAAAGGLAVAWAHL